jgi:hypothetical protein
MLVFSIRRHRIDDFRGRYRIWLMAAAACLLTSANSVIGFHQVLADALGHAFGRTALRDGAVWWLALAGLPAVWIVARSLLDARESRLAAALLSSAGLCYLVGAVSYLRLLPTSLPPMEPITTGAAIMIGHWLTFAATLAYARFVILDAQGLIVARPSLTRRSQQQSTVAEQSTDESNQQTSVSPSSPPAEDSSWQRPATPPQTARSRGASTQWIDGSRQERHSYEDEIDDDPPDNDRKVNKSERKRLRKIKAQNRAA